VLDRLHEIGTLRAIGTTRGQMARAVLLEGAFLGIVSGGLAAMFGTVIGYYEIAVLGKSLSGTTLHYSQPLWTITATFMLAVLMAAAAGYWPGRRAARLVIVDALTRD
jgi:putative ABC transport system permease protein